MMQEQRFTGDDWDNLPLPDVDAAWQNMEDLLDGKKRRRAVPFWLWGALAGGLLTAGFWLWSSQHQEATSTATTAQPKTSLPLERTVTNQPENTSVKKQAAPVEVSSQQPLKNDLTQSPVAFTSPVEKAQLPARPLATNTLSKKTTLSTKTTIRPSSTNNNTATKSRAFVLNKGTTITTVAPASSQPKMIAEEKKKSAATADSTDKPVDTAKAIVATPAVEAQPAKKKSSRFVWSAGIGLQQAIAVAGQSSSSYNYNGHRASLSDRIPSVYLRAEKGKWFAQLEALYAAPQPVRSFYFSQHTSYNAASANLQTERFAIQKLYYHQLPVSINYHVLPNISVGVGGSYNILAGAVTEQEVTSKNVATGTESTVNKLAPVKGYKDSFLYKTTAGVLVQTDFHIKRFSLGLRYTQNLQPFIKYTKPDGTLMDEKTGVLQAVLRFRLWRG